MLKLPICGFTERYVVVLFLDKQLVVVTSWSLVVTMALFGLPAQIRFHIQIVSRLILESLDSKKTT